MGPRKAVAQSSDDEDDFVDASEQLPPQGTRPSGRSSGRRPGKEPVGDDGDYVQPEVKESDEDEAVPDEAGVGPSSRKRRSAPGGTTAPKRARPGGAAAAKQEPAAARASGRAGGGVSIDGPIVVSRDELLRIESMVSNYEMEAAQLGGRVGSSITQQGLDALTRLVMRHMIFRHAELPGVPVPRADLTKLISANTNNKKAGLPAYVIALAQHKMLDCLGLEMKEVVKPSATRGARGGVAAAPAGEGSKHFVLRSAVPPALHAAVVRNPDGDAEQGFLATVLALIALAGGKITADELWRHLGDMAVWAEREHPTLGRPSAVMDALVKKRYIQRDRAAGADGEEVTYAAAENAKDEIGEGKVKAWYEEEFAAAERNPGGAGAGAGEDEDGV